MSKKIDSKLTAKIARLANIKLTEEEIKTYSDQLGSILEYVSKLEEADTKGKEFKSQVDMENVTREDVASDSLDKKDALSNRKKRVEKDSFTISNVF